MVEEKSLTIAELKYGYDHRHGFVFQGPVRSSNESIENLCKTLIKHKITEVSPEFIVRLSDSVVAFVYPDGVSFDCPRFMEEAAKFGGMFRVETLMIALKNL